MFFDRYDAGAQLASRLMHYKNTDAVVFAIPNGGVLTGLVVAEKLELPLELIISRKIGHPLNKEYAVCAVTENGVRVCNDHGFCGIDTDKIEIETRLQQRLAIEKRSMCGKCRNFTSLRGKTAIIVDDGIATGLTMKAAVLAVRKLGADKIIVAVPVALHDVLKSLGQTVNEIVIIHNNQRHSQAISNHYKYFTEVFDKDVIACIQKAERRYRGVLYPNKNSKKNSLVI